MKWPIHGAVFFLAAENPLKTKLSNLTYSNQNPPPRMPSWQIKDWTNPFEKYIQVKLDHLPKVLGWTSKHIWNHHSIVTFWTLKMEVWFKCFFFLFKGIIFRFPCEFFFCFGVGVQQFHHFFWRVSYPPTFYKKPFAVKLSSQTGRTGNTSPFRQRWNLGVFHVFFCPSKRSRGPTGPKWGLLKATVLSIVITASLIKHGMMCYVSTHSASRWSCPSRCSSRSWGWCGSQPSSSMMRCGAVSPPQTTYQAGCERLPWRCGHVAHSQVHAICTVRILRTLSPLHISMSSSLDANSYLVLKHAVHQPTEQFCLNQGEPNMPRKNI